MVRRQALISHHLYVSKERVRRRQLGVSMVLGHKKGILYSTLATTIDKGETSPLTEERVKQRNDYWDLE